MALFRFHKGALAESLATTVVVKNKSELTAEILKWHFQSVNIQCGVTYSFSVHIEEYPSNNNFDSRIGWYTHIVTFAFNDNPPFPVGFLSEALSEEEEKKREKVSFIMGSSISPTSISSEEFQRMSKGYFKA